MDFSSQWAQTGNRIHLDRYLLRKRNSHVEMKIDRWTPCIKKPIVRYSVMIAACRRDATRVESPAMQRNVEGRGIFIIIDFLRISLVGKMGKIMLSDSTDKSCGISDKTGIDSEGPETRDRDENR